MHCVCCSVIVFPQQVVVGVGPSKNPAVGCVSTGFHSESLRTANRCLSTTYRMIHYTTHTHKLQDKYKINTVDVDMGVQEVTRLDT